MSLILEALRKSEAERRRGQAPGLFVEQIPVPVARRARTPAWTWMLVALLLGVLVLLAWREFGRGMPEADVPAAAEARDAAQPVAPGITEPTRGDPIDVASSDPVVSTPALVPAPAARPPVMQAPAEAPAASPTPAETTASVPGVVTSPDAASAAVAPSPPVTSDEAVPRLASLPASDRAQLPPLKLSMHVYADDPAQRFVILDGRRLQEGASPAAGVVIEQIRRDGLVLSVNGQRVLLARP
jgi:general secretion pathway protein B